MPAQNAVLRYRRIAYDGTNGTEVAAEMGLPVVSDDGENLVVDNFGDEYAIAAGSIAVWRTDGTAVSGLIAMPPSQADELYPVLANTALEA